MAKTMYCTTCGHVGPTKKHTPGSFWVELALWFLFLAPGLVYSIWRLSARKPACAECASIFVIPATSPAARKAVTAEDGRDLSYLLTEL